jgi:high mobility group protein B2
MPRKKATKGRKGKAKSKAKAKPVAEKKRRNRRNKDPNRPKRAMSAFMFFSNANREIVKAQSPNLSFTEIAREIGSRWKNLRSSDKAPYQTLADQDRARYEEEKRMYTPDPKYLVQDTKNGKPKKDPNAPKRAMSGFMFFSNHMRPKLKQRHPDITFLELGTEIGKLWRGLSATKRKPYMQLAAEDKARYQEEKANYVAPPQYANKKGKKKDPNAPKRGMSAYLYYCQSYRKVVQKKHPKKKMTELAVILAANWKKASKSQRKKFQDMAEKDKQRYFKEKIAYDKKKRR